MCFQLSSIAPKVSVLVINLLLFSSKFIHKQLFCDNRHNSHRHLSSSVSVMLRFLSRGCWENAQEEGAPFAGAGRCWTSCGALPSHVPRTPPGTLQSCPTGDHLPTTLPTQTLCTLHHPPTLSLGSLFVLTCPPTRL